MGNLIMRCVRYATYLHDKNLDRQLDSTDCVFAGLAIAPEPPPRIKSVSTAIIDRNQEEARRILTEQPEARDKVNSTGETVMHMACSLGYYDMFTVLLECGCPTGVRTALGTPLHSVLKAVRAGYLSHQLAVQMVQTLVETGCDVNASDRGQRTPLFCAADCGDDVIVRELLRHNADVTLDDVNCFSPLYTAVIHAELECVKVLLDAPIVRVNQHDAGGRTSLLAALILINNSFWNGGPPDLVVRHRLMAVVEMLLAAGADPNTTDIYGRVPLVMAFVMVELDCLTRMARQGVGDISYYVTKSTCELLEGTRGTGVSSNDGNRDDGDRLMDVFFKQCAAQTEDWMLSESSCTALTRLFLLYGARFVHPWQRNYREAPAWLLGLYIQAVDGSCCLPPPPHPLTHITRLAIRRHLASVDRIPDIARVPLPAKLLDYSC